LQPPSYIHSLTVAVGHFLGSTDLNECLGAQDKQWLFSKLPEVKSTSERFLQDLEQRLEADVLRFSVCDVVLQHCPAFRRVYLPYVTNQAYQERTYQRLLLENPKFPSILARLEESPVCQRLPLTSFLILPFQRITRLKMLVEPCAPPAPRRTRRSSARGKVVASTPTTPMSLRLGTSLLSLPPILGGCREGDWQPGVVRGGSEDPGRLGRIDTGQVGPVGGGQHQESPKSILHVKDRF
uniref:DH domain-containing protein n=1 Tax=Spermophilus dauricus TaxID=99837 RepID=A0A8C9Q3D2_SPEDA